MDVDDNNVCSMEELDEMEKLIDKLDVQTIDLRLGFEKLHFKLIINMSPEVISKIEHLSLSTELSSESSEVKTNTTLTTTEVSNLTTTAQNNLTTLVESTSTAIADSTTLATTEV